jgi:hypothetical protein
MPAAAPKGTPRRPQYGFIFAYPAICPAVPRSGPEAGSYRKNRLREKRSQTIFARKKFQKKSVAKNFLKKIALELFFIFAIQPGKISRAGQKRNLSKREHPLSVTILPITPKNPSKNVQIRADTSDPSTGQDERNFRCPEPPPSPKEHNQSLT